LKNQLVKSGEEQLARALHSLIQLRLIFSNKAVRAKGVVWRSKMLTAGIFNLVKLAFCSNQKFLAMQQAASLGYLLISKGCISFSKI
jgi:hypothetical protein